MHEKGLAGQAGILLELLRIKINFAIEDRHPSNVESAKYEIKIENASERQGFKFSLEHSEYRNGWYCNNDNNSDFYRASSNGAGISRWTWKTEGLSLAAEESGLPLYELTFIAPFFSLSS